MSLPPLRVYADTSVFGGVFDEEFAKPSRRFFELVMLGRFQLVCSGVLQDEVMRGPSEVRAYYESILPYTETVIVPTAALDLQAEYIRHGIVTDKWSADALHVAAATVLNCRIIVSWNFKHIVNYRRVQLYNAVNQFVGYGGIAICSPQEVLEDDNEEEEV